MAEKDTRTRDSDMDFSGAVEVINRNDESVRGTSDSPPCDGAGSLTCGNAGRDEGWLRLGVGSSCSTSSVENWKHAIEHREGLLDLNLFSDVRPSGSRITEPNSLCFMSSAAGIGPSTNLTWGSSIPKEKEKPIMHNATTGSRNHSEGMRVVFPPHRSQNGLWFTLEVSQKQDVRRPFLLQLTPKRYYRIKDEKMKVCMVMKYLTSKLGLESESEVEITCRGQVVHPRLTLQHVRNNIWCERDIVAWMPDSTIDNVMILQYGRSTFTISSAQI